MTTQPTHLAESTLTEPALNQADLDQAGLTQAGLSQAEIGEFIRLATCDVFATMFGLELDPETARVGRSAADQHAGIIVTLGLTGARKGSGQLLFEPALACRLASAMLMAEYTSVDDDVVDALAETGNMVVGNVKNLLETRLGPMGLSTPAVVYGGEFATRTAGDPEWVILPFRCGDDSLIVQLTLTDGQAGPKVYGRSRSPVQQGEQGPG